jgi:glutamate/tyrosine decarboxylase-like PLP-dependent enzyme
MTADGDAFAPALTRAAHHAQAWLDSMPQRRIAARASADELVEAFGGPLPEQGLDPAQVIDELAVKAEPGLIAMPSGRFYGWVLGGALPAALGADWLVSAWDQNTGLRFATPAVVAAEEVAAAWLLELLGLPADADVGFVTGGTMANFTCLSAARQAQLTKAGWNLDEDGLAGAPRVHVLAGEERHATIDVALRYLGLGRPTVVAADEQGRLRVDALREALERVPPEAPIIVALQAGDLHSGAFDPFREAIELAHSRGAWVHVDGAFGLWAATVPRLAPLVDGVAEADSWATDAHKTLNVPYDSGLAIVRDTAALRAAFGIYTSYLMADTAGPGDPSEKVPELSRRARGVPVWAALRSLGREGVVELVDRLTRHARALADGVVRIPGARVLNDVSYTQVCVAFEDDARTREVTARLLADGEVWMSGSRWKGRDVLRISVSNWSTDEQDVAVSLEALRRAAAE